MARRFNGSSDFIVFTLPTTLETVTAGSTTIVFVANFSNATDGAMVHARTSGGTNSWWMESFTDWNYGQGATAKNVGAITTGSWAAYVGRKTTGGANAPRGRKIIFGGATTDVTAGSGLSDGTAPGAGGILQVGKWGTASEFIAADVAAVAVFNSDLDDTTTATFTTWQAILDAEPVWAVHFDQASATDAITDATDNGGNSSSITGTTIVANPDDFFAGGPTEYTQTNTGSVTPAGALVRQAAKLPAGSLTPAGALVRSTSKSQAGTLTPQGVLVRQTAKSFAGALTPAGALTTLKAALRTFTGTLTPTGALTRQVGKALSGALAPTGSVQRLTARTFAGTLTAVGTLAKQTAKRFLGALTPAGAVTTSAGPATPARDLQLTVGAPEASWTTGLPSSGWSVDEPRPKWTTSLPEV